MALKVSILMIVIDTAIKNKNLSEKLTVKIVPWKKLF